MKKKIMLLALLLLTGLSNALMADNVITTNNVTIRPGGTAELVVSLQNDADFKVYAYDFRLYLPDGIEVAKKANGSYIYELKERNADHGANVQMTADGAVQFGVNSPALFLEGTDGPVLGITLQADATLQTGVKLTGSIKAIHYANKEAQTVAPADMTFDIEVSDLVVLDETSTTPPETVAAANVLVKRTISAGQWTTICLPFAMTEAQVKTAFGSDVLLGDFKGYETQENVDEDVVGIIVNFEYASQIEANHPYLIKVTDDVTEFMAEGVDIEPEDEPTVAALKRTKKQWSEMTGSYVPMTIDDEMLYLNEGVFAYSDGTANMLGYRAYFDFYDTLSDVDEADTRVLISFNGEIVGIASLVNSGESSSVYDLQGRKIEKPSKKGVYIRSGAKVVVKD